ncbi:unnamed protein product [Prorocentrum cordatum]|uniref:C3H1-type domain-containing protein n=1 Tax=Prorocentrum cordatum TaxID=2364126 RepID=A0ABN9Q3C9_9DINO|nr:unnamed protein product [Polarella glacialis]
MAWAAEWAGPPGGAKGGKPAAAGWGKPSAAPQFVPPPGGKGGAKGPGAPGKGWQGGWGGKPEAAEWEEEPPGIKGCGAGWKGGQLGPPAGQGGAAGWQAGGKAAGGRPSGGAGWQAPPSGGRDGWKGGKQASNSWGGQQGGQDEELLWEAVSAAVKPILHMENELDESKLEKRIRDAFKKGAKGLSFGARPWHALVEEYADSVMGSIFNSCGDKGWLLHIDLLLCMDAGIKDHFPPQSLRGVPPADFEQCVLAAYEKAFEEQRVGPIIWDLVTASVEGPKSKKKVFNACEAAFKESRIPGGAYPNGVQDFVAQFVDRSIALLAEETQGEPQWVLDPKDARAFFSALVDGGVVPFPLVQEHGPPPSGDPFLAWCVQEAYNRHAVNPDGSPFGSKGKGGKGGTSWASKKAKPKPKPLNPLFEGLPNGICRDFLLDKCERGDGCRFTHDEEAKAEVALRQAMAEAEKGEQGGVEEAEDSALEGLEPDAKKLKTGDFSWHAPKPDASDGHWPWPAIRAHEWELVRATGATASLIGPSDCSVDACPVRGQGASGGVRSWLRIGDRCCARCCCICLKAYEYISWRLPAGRRLFLKLVLVSIMLPLCAQVSAGSVNDDIQRQKQASSAWWLAVLGMLFAFGPCAEREADVGKIGQQGGAAMLGGRGAQCDRGGPPLPCGRRRSRGLAAGGDRAAPGGASAARGCLPGGAREDEHRLKKIPGRQHHEPPSGLTAAAGCGAGLLLELGPLALEIGRALEVSPAAPQIFNMSDAESLPADSSELNEMFSFVHKDPILFPALTKKYLSENIPEAKDPFAFVADHMWQQ